jgi:glycine/D-amino acid oxidase-like deaminating enzyme
MTASTGATSAHVARADVVVIGGGIRGTAAAYELARSRARVVLLENLAGRSGACY